MTRRLVALNLLLVALIVAASWRMRTVWIEQEQQSARFFNERVQPLAPPVVVVPDAPPRTMALEYLGVAQQLMFSRDRNPNVIVEVAEPKPMPALPRYYGLINFGEGPKVVLAASGDSQKSYREGQQVGDFKLVSIQPAGLVFEWDGKRVPASYLQLRDTRPPDQVQPKSTQAAAAPATTQAAKSATATSVGGASDSGPGVDTGGSVRPCKAGDTSPAGTVVDGFKKVLADTPFGKSCFWEKVR